jgi:hypothetical protein
VGGCFFGGVIKECVVCPAFGTNPGVLLEACGLEIVAEFVVAKNMCCVHMTAE